MQRSLARRAATIGTLATLAALGAAGPAAAQITLTSGHADWGVKQSFRAYVTGPIAHGQITTSRGATTNADGSFRFPLASGTYDLAAHAVTAAFAGSVRFTGHDSGSGPALDLTISDPRVVTAGDAGTLYADMRSRDMASGEYTEYDDAAVATLDLGASQLVPGNQEVSIGPIAATLTADGAAAFSGFYPAGTALDPLSLRLSYATQPGPQPKPKPQPKPQPQPEPQPDVEPAPAARITALARKVAGPRVAVARLACRTGACTIDTPRRVAFKVAGRRHRATVVAPKRLAAGERATVRLKLRKRTLAALAGRRARVRLNLTVTSGDQTIARTIRVWLRR